MPIKEALGLLSKHSDSLYLLMLNSYSVSSKNEKCSRHPTNSIITCAFSLVERKQIYLILGTSFGILECTIKKQERLSLPWAVYWFPL